MLHHHAFLSWVRAVHAKLRGRLRKPPPQCRWFSLPKETKSLLAFGNIIIPMWLTL